MNSNTSPRKMSTSQYIYENCGFTLLAAKLKNYEEAFKKEAGTKATCEELKTN